ncbi:MAG: hypothetical protein M1813_006440 [Trichoglossum hirsutum]|nr:MAG: hypothetical protein M1813_007452 [Trichoglossum hirsutum]KAI9859897.1 MAG: hypothetical protein M1813_006440 [Trichoglossum hirsutum]
MALFKIEIIKSKLIEEGLNDFRDLYNATQTDISELSDAVRHMHISDKGLKNLVLDLILALQSLLTARLLSSPNRYGTLFGDLSRFNSVVDSSDFDLRSAISLLNKVVDKALDADI